MIITYSRDESFYYVSIMNGGYKESSLDGLRNNKRLLEDVESLSGSTDMELVEEFRSKLNRYKSLYFKNNTLSAENKTAIEQFYNSLEDDYNEYSDFFYEEY